MSEGFDQLARTKPLTDPLRFLTKAILVFAGCTFVAGLMIVLLYHASIGWGLLGASFLPLSMFVLFSTPLRKPNAIYLRAFRTDRETAKLRNQLIAVLGPKFRLSGIRPPREQSSVFFRFLLPGLFALKYGGSKFMELEAGDDWMARLWMTYQSVRVVFIDIRDVTLYVHQEIRMTLQSVGAARCAFLIDLQQKPEADWRIALADVLGDDCDVSQLALLDVSPAAIESKSMSRSLAAILARLPEGESGSTAAGREFILDHVPAEVLARGNRPSIATILTAVVATLLCFSLSLLAAPTMPPVIKGIVTTLAILVTPVLIVVIIARIIARGFRLMSTHASAGIRAWLTLPLGLLLYAMAGGVIGGGTAYEYVRAHPDQFPSYEPEIPHETGSESTAVSALRDIYHSQLSSYASSHGFYCKFSTAPADGNLSFPGDYDTHATVAPDGSSAVWKGYTYSLSHCATAPDSSSGTTYAVIAVSNITGKKHGRSICLADDTQNLPSYGVISEDLHIMHYDPNGGTNCTDQVNLH